MRRVKVSALALIKMAMHCRSGGEDEVRSAGVNLSQLYNNMMVQHCAHSFRRRAGDGHDARSHCSVPR